MMTVATIQELQQMATSMRLTALDMALGAGRNGAHLGAAMSAMEIMAVLYGRVLHLGQVNPAKPDGDRFLASKAHCVLAHYTALAEIGLISREELGTFGKSGTRLAGHPAMNPELGLEYSGGSLGQAIGFAIGLALDARRKGRNHRVFVLMGDGELNEGSNWEGFMAAAHFKLNNLIAIVDKNQLQYDGPTEEIMALGDLGAKLQAFGWQTAEVDGHDVGQLLAALKSKPGDQPLAVIANTIKGKGVSFMENVREWHHSTLSQAQYNMAVKEVREAASL
ncbi:MAG: transketolase [Deltaproteobacteria bacterium]|jgi:transketolase|nr:transketolase [Deltaproteobacteria bacterium]